MTAHEAFISGIVWGTLAAKLADAFEIEPPAVDGAPLLVVRGKKTGAEVQQPTAGLIIRELDRDDVPPCGPSRRRSAGGGSDGGRSLRSAAHARTIHLHPPA